MTEASILCRVSTSDQRDNGTSLEDQKTGGLRKAARLGATTREEHIILEDWSGTDLSRPGLLRLYQLAEDGSIDLVIVSNLDRLYRPEYDGDEWKIFLVLERLENAGVKVIWNDPGVPSEGPTGLHVHLSGFLALWEGAAGHPGTDSAGSAGHRPQGGLVGGFCALPV